MAQSLINNFKKKQHFNAMVLNHKATLFNTLEQ